MTNPKTGVVAILRPGDPGTGTAFPPDFGRLAGVAEALRAVGLSVESALYADDSADEVREQLGRVDAVLVWVNPIEAGRDRSVLDAMLRDVMSRGVIVSAAPEVILKMGTKEVLWRTRDLGWGSDVHRYATMDELRRELPGRLDAGKPRVLKQYRGNGGDGVWKIQRRPGSGSVLARHALRGSVEEEMPLSEFIRRCEPYFAGSGRMIDQPYQERLQEGMIRCYVVHDRVVGFGHQAINALHPSAPRPGPRLYHPPTVPEFQRLKEKLEREWIPAMQRMLGIPASELPFVWDADFLFGPQDANGGDTFVLCEINVSSVFPFPDHALAPLAGAVAAAVGAR